MKISRRILRFFQPGIERERRQFRTAITRALAEAEGVVHECNRITAKGKNHLKIVKR